MIAPVEMSSGEKRRRNGQYRYIQQLCSQVGLGRDDRMVLANNLLNCNGEVSSFTELTVEQLELTILVLQGHRLIQQLRLANGSLIDECEIVLQIMSSPTDLGGEESGPEVPDVVVRPLGVHIPSQFSTRRERYQVLRNLSFKAGMDREDRLELARHLFPDTRDLDSISELSLDRLDQLVHTFKAHLVIQQLRLANGALVDQCMIVTQRLKETAIQSVIRQNETGEWD